MVGASLFWWGGRCEDVQKGILEGRNHVSTENPFSRASRTSLHRPARAADLMATRSSTVQTRAKAGAGTGAGAGAGTGAGAEMGTNDTTGAT
jgi:hypothetical protein